MKTNQARHSSLLLLLSVSFFFQSWNLPLKADTTSSSSETFLENQVNQQLAPGEKKSVNAKKASSGSNANASKQLTQASEQPESKNKLFKKKNKKDKPLPKPKEQSNNSATKFTPISISPNEGKTAEIVKENNTSVTENKELKQITKDRKKNTQKTIDAINFIQPSIEMSQEEQDKVNVALTKSEQEQLTILWRATLERNKTIHFIVEKLAPDDKGKKKNQVLSQILNTAIFLPFYALQTVAPADTSSLASYIGAGLASDVINGQSRKNSDRMQLSQTEMVIMFMMIDQVAERLRSQYHLYKQEKIDLVLAQNELDESKQEAAASLETQSAEGRFLAQIRIRQIEREMRRINLRVRSNRIVLVDLSGSESVDTVDKLIDKEIAAVIDLPPLTSNVSSN